MDMYSILKELAVYHVDDKTVHHTQRRSRYNMEGDIPEKQACQMCPGNSELKKGFYLSMERCVDVSSVAPLGSNIFLLLTQWQSDTSFSVLTAHQLR